MKLDILSYSSREKIKFNDLLYSLFSMYICRHIEFRFKSIAEADEMIETLKTIKEGVVVKRLVGGMNAGKCIQCLSSDLLYGWVKFL